MQQVIAMQTLLLVELGLIDCYHIGNYESWLNPLNLWNSYKNSSPILAN